MPMRYLIGGVILIFSLARSVEMILVSISGRNPETVMSEDDITFAYFGLFAVSALLALLLYKFWDEIWDAVVDFKDHIVHRLHWFVLFLSSERLTLNDTVNIASKNNFIDFSERLLKLNNQSTIVHVEQFQTELKNRNGLSSKIAEVCDALKIVDVHNLRSPIRALNDMRQTLNTYQHSVDSLTKSSSHQYEYWLRDRGYSAFQYYNNALRIRAADKFSETIDMFKKEIISGVDELASAVTQLSKKLESHDQLNKRFDTLESQTKVQNDRARASFETLLGEGKEVLDHCGSLLDQVVNTKGQVEEVAEDQLSDNRVHREFIEETIDTLKRDMANLHEYFGTLRTQNEALMAANANDSGGSSMQELRALVRELKDV